MMDMTEALKGSEAIEIGLRSGHVVYGRFKRMLGQWLVLSDPDGQLVFVPADEPNIAYIKLVAADAEIGAAMDKADAERGQPPEGEQPSRRVDVPPVILPGAPSGRHAAIEEVKERFRHNTSFTSQMRPAFRPRIETEEKKEEE